MEEIFQRLTCQRDEYAEQLEFERLTRVEVAECLKNAHSDIDFLCVTGDLEKILQNKELRRMIGACNGSFYQKSKVEQLRLDKKTTAFNIVDLRPYTISIIGENEREHSNEDESFDCSTEIEENGISEKILYQKINGILENISSKNDPFRDIEEILKEVFVEYRIAVFIYGQKQSLTDYQALLNQMTNDVEVFIAVGIELELQNATILCSNEGQSIGESFYSMFLSKEYGSILIKNHAFASKMVTNSYRVCIYNTSHHKRKTLDPRLDIEQLADNSSLLTKILHLIYDKTIALEGNVLPLIRSSKLRCEAYFKLNTST